MGYPDDAQENEARTYRVDSIARSKVGKEHSGLLFSPHVKAGVILELCSRVAPVFSFFKKIQSNNQAAVCSDNDFGTGEGCVTLPFGVDLFAGRSDHKDQWVGALRYREWLSCGKIQKISAIARLQ